MRLDAETCARIGAAWGTSARKSNLLAAEVVRLVCDGASFSDDGSVCELGFDNGTVTLWSIDPFGSALAPTAFFEDGSVVELDGI